mgnify:FL=1
MKPRFGAHKGDHRVGHIAASPVTFDSTEGWFGLGPVSGLPDQQGNGIGSALIKAPLNQLKQAGAAGTVISEEPEYCCRFGFKQMPGPYFPDTPAEYFTVLPFGHETPAGPFAIIARLASAKNLRSEYLYASRR